MAIPITNDLVHPYSWWLSTWTSNAQEHIVLYRQELDPAVCFFSLNRKFSPCTLLPIFAVPVCLSLKRQEAWTILVVPMRSGQATDLGYTFPKKLGRTYDKELGQSLSCLHQRAWTILVMSGT